mmetsp:Transcript_17462/g.42637  ORF Transcript_17462/g.42637 Transcript_17462/m.42637 type:complete len:332 (+) Transcript_17462:184-1179(+)
MQLLRAAAALALLACVAGSLLDAEETPIVCDANGENCKVNLGKAGMVKLPAKVALSTAHGSYLSMTPPHGGHVRLKTHPYESEEWDLQKDGDKHYLQSWFKTYLSSNWDAQEGYKLTKLKFNDEAFVVQTVGQEPYCTFKGSNGKYLSANPDVRDGVKQADRPDAWEIWEMHNSPHGRVILRSAHGTFLGAGAPHSHGNVTHAYEIDTWEVFTLNHLHGRVTIQSSHGTYLAAHAKAETNRRMMCSSRASLWELWTPWLSKGHGKICLQANGGDFLWADESKPNHDGFGLMGHCLEHELLEVHVIDDQKMAEIEARRRAQAAQAAAAHTHM